jgi:putative membrane protein
MTAKFLPVVAALALLSGPALAATGPTDPQIAHIAYTAGSLDITAGKDALAHSTNPTVREFAELMIRDHQAVNDKAVALLNKLHVKPEANPTSAALSKEAAAIQQKLNLLRGDAFDRAYIANEVAFHRTVNGALEKTLIPDAHNAELKSLLETGLALFREHQAHAEQLEKTLK